MAPRREVHHTQHEKYNLLEVEYDKKHRAHFLSDRGAELAPLRPHTHNRQLEWFEEYVPYIRRASFLELVRVVNKGLPPLNPHSSVQLSIETGTLEFGCGTSLVLSFSLMGRATPSVGCLLTYLASHGRT
jgi:hypothetical protein